MSFIRRTALLLALSAIAGASPARAEEIKEFPHKSMYVGLFGGGNINLSDWDLGTNPDSNPRIKPKTSADFGLRVGFHVTAQIAFEAAIALLPLSVDPAGSATVLNYNADAIFHLMKKRWSPFINVGVGMYQSTGGDLGKDTDYNLHAGLGARVMILPWLAGRVEVRDYMTDGYDTGFLSGNNLELTAGLDFFGWREYVMPDKDKDGVGDKDDACPEERGLKTLAGCPDRDGDGIADKDDKCPDVVGLKTTGGCPDQDGDGIADAEDKCPAVAGIAALEGCPDQDGDGITDADDKCPALAGPAATGGCPDQDGDGIADAEDKCPEQAGPAATGGCPDKDGDGIADAEDRCPDQAGPAQFKGCPDTDGDGIPDVDDRCPNQAGVAEEQGCLPKAIEAKFTGSIKGINFETGSAKIVKGSFPLLDEAVAVLKQYPGLRLRIEGHTDNVGKADKNLQLSKDRAESVRAYFQSKGIDAARLEGEGFGDTKPKGDNKKAAGRAENRRIEFSILGASK